MTWALKSCPKYNKSPNLVTLPAMQATVWTKNLLLRRTISQYSCTSSVTCLDSLALLKLKLTTDLLVWWNPNQAMVNLEVYQLCLWIFKWLFSWSNIMIKVLYLGIPRHKMDDTISLSYLERYFGLSSKRVVGSCRLFLIENRFYNNWQCYTYYIT